ncbi:MAG: DUF3343 domain-containing protein [Spirochaetota bacterium]
MSKKGKSKFDVSELEGVVTFFGSHHALRAEEVLKKNGLKALLVPGPREISPNCGVALRFDYREKDRIVSLFNEYFVHYEEIHYYPPRTKSI